MSETAYVDTLPQCNFCQLDAEYDSALIAGSWAYLCAEHWAAYGVKKLGTGFGQKLLVFQSNT